MPGDTKTHLARLAKRSRRSRGSLDAARLRLSSALDHAEAVMKDAAEAGDGALVLKAVHSITQATGSFAKLVEVGELEARLAELETALERSPSAGTYGGARA